MERSARFLRHEPAAGTRRICRRVCPPKVLPRNAGKTGRPLRFGDLCRRSGTTELARGVSAGSRSGEVRREHRARDDAVNENNKGSSKGASLTAHVSGGKRNAHQGSRGKSRRCAAL